MTSLAISSQHRTLEIAAEPPLANSFFMDWLKLKLPFIAVGVVGWMGYVMIRARQAPRVVQHWGYRVDTFTRVLRVVLPFGIMAIVIFAY